MVRPFPRSLFGLALLSLRAFSLSAASLLDDALCFIFSSIQCSLTLCVSRSGKVLALCRSLLLCLLCPLSLGGEPHGEPSVVVLSNGRCSHLIQCSSVLQ
jgi:hypothetical protein